MPSARPRALDRPWVAATLAAGGLVVATAALLRGVDEDLVIAGFAALAIGLPVAYLAWHADPAYTFAAAIVLAPFSGHWEGVGIPGQIAPDRLLLVLGIAAVILRAPGIRDRAKLRVEPVHWWLAAAAAFAAVSAAVSGTLDQTEHFFTLFESLGIVPFLVFLLAPVVFSTARQRLVLLGALVGLGAYLGLTALFEATGLDALVFPRYILDPEFGIHADRARGPFVQPATNGMALFACAIAATIATRIWKQGEARLLAAGVAVLCLAGAVLTMQRSVWLGAALGMIVMLVAARELRRALAPVIVTAILALAAAFVVVPGLGSDIEDRGADLGTVWGRVNLNRAALNMVEARPLTGFGWGTFDRRSADYFEQAADIPLSGTESNLAHNVLLNYAADLGLVGSALWLGALFLAVGGALATRGPPDLRLWRAGLVAVATFFLVAMLVTPPKVFPILILLLWAGVVWSGRYEGSAAGRSQRDRRA